jgi:hypothetical protein
VKYLLTQDPMQVGHVDLDSSTRENGKGYEMRSARIVREGKSGTATKP